jgi:hypothetical protein
MAALCMAVLAVVALTLVRRPGWGTASLTAALPSATSRLIGNRLRAPPGLPSRIDAGVLLRV